MIYYHPQINQLWIHVVGDLWLRVNSGRADCALCPHYWLTNEWNAHWTRIGSTFPEDVEVE